MAVDESPENRKPRVTQTPGSKKKKVRSRYFLSGQWFSIFNWKLWGCKTWKCFIKLIRSGHHEPGRKGHAVTPGKRKRSAREKSVESGEVTFILHWTFHRFGKCQKKWKNYMTNVEPSPILFYITQKSCDNMSEEKSKANVFFSLQVFIGIESFLRTFLFLEVVGVLWRVTPKAWAQTKLLQLATSFGALLHFQARSLKKCIQAV